MYHRPGSDRFIGRRSPKRPTRRSTPTPDRQVRDHTGKVIPPPPQVSSFGPGPLVKQAAGSQESSLVLACWEALVQTNPLALRGHREVLEHAYHRPALALANAVRTGVARPVRMVHVQTALAVVEGQSPALNGRSRRAAALVSEALSLL